MIEFLNQIPNIGSAGLLISSSIAGTIFAYWQKWAWDQPSEDESLMSYFFGDGKATARVMTKLIGALAVALTVDLHGNMDTVQIIVLGTGIGLAVPEKVKSQEKKSLSGLIVDAKID